MKNFLLSTNPSKKLDRCICLDNCADYAELATPVAGTPTLRYWAKILYIGVSIELIPIT